MKSLKKSGIGLRTPHYREILATQPDVGWLEVHSENYFGAGGQPLYFLEQLRRDYPLSLHGVGLSLGSTDPLHYGHLNKIKSLIERFDPVFVSEHVSWSSVGGHYLNDLLPLPYTEEALNLMVNRIDEVQTYLNRKILIENISAYWRYPHSTLPEEQFLVEIAQRSGCGILLDVNNLYVNATNHGINALAYLRAIPTQLVEEIHLAGFDTTDTGLIDTHGKPVAKQVWDLYSTTIDYLGDKPTLIEWDTDIPTLSELCFEAEKADQIRFNYSRKDHALAA